MSNRIASDHEGHAPAGAVPMASDAGSRLAQVMPVLALVWDTAGSLVWWNDECARLLGRERLASGDLAGLFPDADSLNVFTRLMACGEFEDQELAMLDRDGRPIVVSWSSRCRERPVDGWGGWMTGRDVSRQASGRDAAAKERLRLKALHELSRMPWTGIEAMADFVLDRCLALTGSAAGILGFVHDDASFRAMAVARPDNGRKRPGRLHLSASEGFMARLVRQTDQIIINNLGDAACVVSLPLGHVPLTRIMTAPVVEQGKVKMAVVLANKPTDYAAEDVGEITDLLEGMWEQQERKREQSRFVEAIRVEHARLYSLLDELPFKVHLVDLNRRIVYANKAFTRAHPHGAQTCHELIHEQERPCVPCRGLQALKSGQPMRFEQTAHGRIFDVHKFPMQDLDGTPYLLDVRVDITDSRLAEERIRASLQEKDILLKEIHHRVKNNLQIISSLLNLQASAVEDGEIRDILLRSQSRVRSMALVHESLYQSGNLGEIDFADYIRRLAAYIKQAYGSADKRIELDIRAEAVRMSINKAVPCGLILNELLTNAYKHGFARATHGSIHVGLTRRGDLVDLIVRDNGDGIPAGLDLERVNSLGLQLVSSLANQLGGRIAILDEGVSVFALSFPL